MAKLTTAFTVFFFCVGVATADEFSAAIKKIDGNKITINKSTKDNPVKDEELVASKDVKVFRKSLTLGDDGNGGFSIEFVDVEVKEGLKSDAFNKEVKVRIKTDDKTKQITEIYLQQNLFNLDGLDGLNFQIVPVDPRKE